MIYKAQPVNGADKVPDLALNVTEEFPESRDIQGTAAAHDAAAQELLALLVASLPGGTVDALLRRLLERRASLLVVAS